MFYGQISRIVNQLYNQYDLWLATTMLDDHNDQVKNT